MQTASTQATTRVHIRRGHSSSSDEATAVAEVFAQVQQDDQRLVLFFASARYDVERLAAALRERTSCVVVGCTSAGELGPDGPSRGGIAALSFAGELDAQAWGIDLANIDADVLRVAADCAEQRAQWPDRGSFGLLLADGLSKREEHLALALYRELPMVPIVGGSAGDDLTFERTHVYVDGAFHSHRAVFVHVLLDAPIAPFKFQHFEPGDAAFVITDADPDGRILREINGVPASIAYADAIGVAPDKLDSAVFSSHPIVVELGGESYVRSIVSVTPDGGLNLFCAIDIGVVFSIGRPTDPAAAARAAFEAARARVGELQAVIGFSCILRRLEFESSCRLSELGDLYVEYRVCGFDTYGEQFNGVHINQTFTGVAIGV